MKFFERAYEATAQQKEKGRTIAHMHGLPATLCELPTGIHSYEKTFSLARKTGYKNVHDSIDTYKILAREKHMVEKRCRHAGIVPVFKGDYITLGSFPRRNVIKEEIIHVTSCGGVKMIEKRAFFDVLAYISYQ